MSKKMLIDASHAEETRVVVLDGNRLEDFDVETVSRKQIKGNIYLAKVIRVEPSLQAAFVDYGGNRHGFLAFGEIHPDYYQIPVADRQKLLALQAEAEAEASRAEEDRAVAEDALEADILAHTAQPLEITQIAIHAAPPPDESEVPLAQAALAAPEDEASEAPETEASEPEPGEALAATETLETVDIEPAPEQIGGDGDDAAEARERRLRQRFLRNYKIQDVIHRRQIMLVQVVKEERGNKGAALTTYLSLAGRFSVLMPNSPTGGGVSRKITSQTDRRRLKETMSELDIPQGMGMIVRTAGANRPKPEIKRDCEYLLRLWDDIRDKTLESTAPALIYEEANLIKRAIRDVYTRDVEDILVDGEGGYKAARDFMRMLMPANARKVQLWQEGQPLFSKYQVETQLDAMLNPVVQLRSGGYIVINQTEALVAIDVNSGRSTRERSVEDTALRTNLEAAEEVAKQLRMRDLAGLIVIDFIDMESRKNNQAVERKMKDALRHDRARIQIGGISHFGLMEMSRQRLRPSLTEASLVTCPHCGGMGHVRSPESAALHILRALEDEGAKFKASEIAVSLPPEIALYLFNHKRERLRQIETRYVMQVFFNGDTSLSGSHFRLERLKAQTAQQPVITPVRPERVLEALAPDPEDNEDNSAETPEAATGAERGERKRRRRRGRRRGETGNGERTAEPRTESDTLPVLVEDQPTEIDLVLQAALGEAESVHATELAGTDMPVQDSAASVEEPAPATAPAKPKRAPRKRKPTVKGEDSPPAASVETPAIPPATEEAPAEPAEPAAPAKPKRAPRKRKGAAEVAPPPVVIETTEAPEDAAPAPSGIKPILVDDAGTSTTKKAGWWRR